jgi:hypothetical protein
VTILLTRTAKVFNDRGPKVVIDGGGKVTLSGGGRVRILYQDTCDPAQVWTTSHCQDQPTPALTVQHLTFADGDATGETFDGGGGGAIFARGGRLKVVGCRFFGNACDLAGPDVGGAAIRALSQSGGLPVQVVGSTFGGAPGLGNTGANGGALSGIGVSWSVWNSVFTHNQAVGAALTRPAPAPRAAAAAGPSTSTATPSRCRSAARASRRTTPSRVGARSSSSATTGAAPSPSTAPRCAATRATASRPPACRGSSTWGGARPP